jgi:RNA polymerase sigma-70 factor (ECF subfamily)
MHEEDRELVERLLARDERVFAQLVTSLHPRLVAMATRILKDEAAAEDVAQETWRRVMRALPNFEGRSRRSPHATTRLSTWIFAMLINRAKTRLARDRRADVASISDEHDPLAGRFLLGQWRESPRPWPSETDPERKLATKEMMALVEQTLSELPERQRLVVTLRDVEGLDAAATCEALGISEENQRVLLHRGRTNLRDLLDRKLRQEKVLELAFDV